MNTYRSDLTVDVSGWTNALTTKIGLPEVVGTARAAATNHQHAIKAELGNGAGDAEMNLYRVVVESELASQWDLDTITKEEIVAAEYILSEDGENLMQASTWYPAQYHWHAPSEHTVDGHLFDAELHFVHSNGKEAPDTLYAVLGVFFREEACDYRIPATYVTKEVEGVTVTTDEIDTEEMMMEEKNAKCKEDRKVSDDFFTSLTAFSADSREPWFDFALTNVDVQAFLDHLNMNNFWSYNGSFTTPPCTEGVRWTVLHADVPIAPEHMNALSARYEDNSDFADSNCIGCTAGNNRVTLPLNARTLYYNDSGAAVTAMSALAVSALAAALL
jgi:carbonic anhydrase